MRALNIRRDDLPNAARLVCSFEANNSSVTEVFIAVPKSQESYLSDGSDCFFIVGSVYAMLLNENYRHRFAVDYRLHKNVQALLRQWRQWYPNYAEIQIEAASLSRKPQVGNGSASFFSGGIDSVFTAVEHPTYINNLISVEHTKNTESEIMNGFKRLEELSEYPVSTNRQHLQVTSNFMTAFPEALNMWAFMIHGAMYAAIAHCLTNQIAHAMLSSTHSYGGLIPWGSHPLTDALVSSSVLRLENYGGTHTRVEKTSTIARDLKALKILSVCSHGRLGGKYVNCSRCQKCLRTMVTLDLIGITPAEATSFDWTDYNPRNMSKIFLRTRNDAIYIEEIRDAARNVDRFDIAKYCNDAIKKSSIFVFMTKIELYLRFRYPALLAYKSSLIQMRGSVYKVLGLRKSI